MKNRFELFEVWELILIDESIRNRINSRLIDLKNTTNPEIYKTTQNHITHLTSIRNEIKFNYTK